MLIHLQFPIVDLRGLAGFEDSRLPVPSWPTPLHDEEFIRSTGIIRKRPKGGLHGWIGEECYCDARQSIKLDTKSIAAGRLERWNLRVAFRRFYFDGTAVAKFEVGFVTDRNFALSHDNALNDFLSELLATLVRIGRQGEEASSCRLIESGKALASLYASASNRHRWRGLLKWIPRQNRESLVIAGTPAVFIEITPRDMNTVNLPLGAREIKMKDACLRLFHWRSTTDGRSFPVWAAVHPDYTKHPNQEKIIEVRKLRLYMLRLSAENQALIRVLKALNSDQIKPKPRSAHSDVLQDYLNRATSNILTLSAKSREFAKGNDTFLSDIATAAESFLSVEERQSALHHLESLQVRKNIFRKVEAAGNLTKVGPTDKFVAAEPSFVLHAHTINIGNIAMPKDQEKLVAVLFGTAFLVALLVLAIVFPQPTTFQYTVFRIVLAVSAAGFVSMTPGFLEVKVSNWLRAGGALAVFAVIYFFSPAALVANP
jgi:hypothetical protein